MKVPFFEGELVRRGSLVFLATLSSSVIVFFANLMLSKILGPESFGIFKTVIYLVSFLPMLTDFGINASLTKYISEFGKQRYRETKYLINWFLKIKILSYVLLVIVLFFLKDYITLFFLKDVSLTYLIFAAIISIIFTYFWVFIGIAQGFQNFKLFSLYQFLNFTSSAVIAILLSPLGLFYIILGWGIGPLIGSLPIIPFVFKKKIFSNYKKIDIKKIFLKFSLPIYPIELSAMLFTAIIPFLSLFFSQTLIGYYAFAFMFYYVTTLFPNSLSAVLFPKISELDGLKRYDHAKHILRKSFLYYSLVAISGLVFVILFSEWFIGFIAKEYLPSLLIFKIIVSLGFVFGYNLIYANYLKGLGKVKKYAIFILFQNILLIMVSFFLLATM